MKPFLFLSTRAEHEVADSEAAAFAHYAGLDDAAFRWHRLDQEPLPELVLEDFSGIILGGSPFNASDDPALKSATQLRVEAELAALLDIVVVCDFPFLGACYGVGTLGRHQGGAIDRQYGEPISAVEVTLTADGVLDPLLRGLPERFEAFVGHKEACSALPPGAALLASSQSCPVQMFRLRENLYATQFHPELDLAGLLLRVDTYQHAGYFPAGDVERVRAAAQASHVEAPQGILRNFVNRYAR
ncbi:glutamine amidotransferase [Psychromicrobium xiongbiense]|uniref:glutamine amidotransferase n=1 Tax=Psychromicrobium xiongbiense TaxID=3051184 RepID=UPI0025549F00|nr:glutamine amidotransferase [Psychromicrobium sp. YIM S02556]